MDSRWTQAVASVAILACAYLGYARTVVPWMEPPAEKQNAGPGIAERYFEAPTARYGELLASLFPEGSWERASDAEILRNDELLLVLRDYKTTEDGRLHLDPCTLVYLPKDATSRSWKIQSVGGAVLEFEGAFNLHGGSVGRLKSGFLPGQVTISSNGNSTAATPVDKNALEERIEMETTGVQLTSERITAPYDVHFRYGPSFGTGRGLTIDLQSSGDDGASGLAKTRAIQVRRIELVKLQQLVFFPPSPKNAGLGADPILPIDVNCEGPLVVDLEAGLAHMGKNVVLKRARKQQSPDSLLCDRLTAHLFREPVVVCAMNDSSSSNAPDLHPALPKLRLQRVVAEGLPAIVTTTTGDGEDLRWHRLESERLEYTLAAQQNDSAANSGIGMAVGSGFRAGGSGRYLTGVPTKRVTQLETRWRDRMEIDTSTQGVVNLLMVGDTVCRAPEIGEIFAQKLWIGLRQTARTPGGSGKLQPEKMVAEEEVEIHTDRLDAYTRRLDVVIQSDASLQPPVAGNGPFLGSATGANGSTGAGHGYSDVATIDRKFAIQGDRLRINVLQNSNRHELNEVLLEGQVRCVESSTNEAESPIEMTGNQFRLSDFTKTSGLAVIKGAPAVVRARQMALSGNNIHVDRDKNQIWIDGRGAATVPLPAAMAARTPNRPAVADIRWEGGLRFDGRSIQCEDRVLVQGPLQRIRADKLAAKLTESVDLTASKLNADAVQLDTITADGNVNVENRTMNDTGWLSIERGLVQRVQINYPAQTIVGAGPGWIETVRRGAALPRIRQTSATPGAAILDGRLTYLRVDFGKGFQGSMARKQLTFRDQIRAVFGPVPNWDAQLELQNGELRPESARLSCHELTVFQVPGRENNPFELSATGNTLIQGKSVTGQLFAARAQRLSFDPGKDLLMLQGDTRSESQLWYQSHVGGPRSSLTARQIKFWPKANRYKLDGVGMLDLNDLGR